MRCAIFYSCFVRAIGLFSFLCVAAQNFAQKKDYFHLRFSWPLYGTPYLVKETYRRLDFDDNTTTGSIWLPSNYPRSAHLPGITLEYGRYVRENISLSLLAGLEEIGAAKGHNTARGYIDFNFINMVATPKINFHHKGFVFGVGPSILVMYYNIMADRLPEYEEIRQLPGLGITVGNTPLKKPKCRVTVFVSINLHPGFETEKLYFTDGLQPFDTFQTKVNPSNLLIGACIKF